MSYLYSISNLFVISVSLFVIGLYFFTIKDRSYRAILKNKIVNKIIELSLPKKTSKEYTILNNIIQDSSFSTNMKEVYFIKIFCIIFALLGAVLIYQTNNSLKEYQIFNTPIYSNFLNTDFRNDPEIRQSNFQIIKKHMGIESILDGKYSNSDLEEILLKNSSIPDYEIKDSVDVLLKDINSMKNLYWIGRKAQYACVIFLIFFLPDLILFINSKLMNNKRKNEIFDLTNLIVLVSGNPNITTRDILTLLIKNSMYLKNHLKAFETEYLISRTIAYEKYLNDKKYISVGKIITALKEIEKSDKNSAIINLKNENESIEKTRKLTYENNISKKAGFLLVVFTIGTLFLVKIIFDVSISGVANMSKMNF